MILILEVEGGEGRGLIGGEGKGSENMEVRADVFCLQSNEVVTDASAKAQAVPKNWIFISKLSITLTEDFIRCLCF